MSRSFFPSRNKDAAPVARPVNPQPTHAQRLMRSNVELMLIEAMRSIRSEDAAEILTTIMLPRFGAAVTERIGERIGTLAHMKGRV